MPNENFILDTTESKYSEEEDRSKQVDFLRGRRYSKYDDLVDN